MRRGGLALAAAALAVAGCGGPASVGGDSTRSPGGFDGAAYPPGVIAPGFSLLDQAGRRVSLAGQRGHVVVLTFASTACRSCRLAAQQIRGALDELGADADARTIFVSASPRADTAARVASFLADASLLTRAAYLTGDPARLRPAWRAYRIAQPQPEDAVTVLLIDRRGHERVAFGLEQLTPEALSHDIRLLEAG